jgi:hypothetical protein
MHSLSRIGPPIKLISSDGGICRTNALDGNADEVNVVFESQLEFRACGFLRRQEFAHFDRSFVCSFRDIFPEC